jgi:menaquinone-dependent protoporphyrinogen IX oxidase
VTAATRYGATTEIAQAIAETLGERGLDATGQAGPQAAHRSRAGDRVGVAVLVAGHPRERRTC